MKKEKEKAPMTVTELASLGGTKRAEKLTALQRKQIAEGAAAARWGSKKDKGKAKRKR